MLRSLYIASTGMLVQRQRMDVLTNNIANIETSGYKKDTLISRSFRDMMIERLENSNILNMSTSIGPLNTGIHADEIFTSFSQGAIEETGRLSDIALQGEGFFVISTPDGNRYTRDGAFAVSSNGYLVNSDGHYVQGENGSIYVGQGEFSINESGEVLVDGEVVNKLRVVTFADLSGLRKTGDNLYMNSNNQAEITPQDTVVRQGSLENSNVNMAQEMVDMMTVSRAYETNQRMVKMLDESLAKSVNEVGKV